MVLGSTQTLTEMSTRNLPGGKGWLAHKAGNLTAICEPTVLKMWEPRRLTTLWASTVSYRDSFTFFTHSFCDMPYKNAYNNSHISSPICWILALARRVNI
jgi:hypothetical protein